MCLLGIAFRQFNEFPVLVLANREEFYARSTAGAQIVPRRGDTAAWLGGIDLLAGGTWLGVNEFGVLVAVTNRAKKSVPENPPSRGQLCRSLLAYHETASVVAAARREMEAHEFAGCNLLVADRDSAIVIEAGDDFQIHSLSPGLHLIANAALNADDDLRIRRVRKEFERIGPATANEWLAVAKRICPLSADGTEPAICLAGTDRGTVSSTVLGLGRQLEASRYWYAPGPPNRTPYDDFTSLLLELFRGDQRLTQPRANDGVSADIEPPYDSPARRRVRESLTFSVRDQGGSNPAQAHSDESAAPYRILLRGPWECEPLARAERDATGAVVWSTADLPAPSTVGLPASWQELFGDFRGRVRLRRRFHPPSNIGQDDRLFITFDGLIGDAAISINGHLLGTVASPEPGFRFDVTGLLSVNSVLEIDLGFFDFAPDASPGGLVAPAALEIQSTA
jgi:uncharacterized protein with NRDE domain